MPEPCPVCPTCPVCPVCPTCPEPEPCPIPEPCPVCRECLITPGIIRGCIWGCQCCIAHEWEVELFERVDDINTFLFCVQIKGCGYFEFDVPYEGCYVLKVRSSENCCKTYWCKPIIVFENVGVSNFIVD